MLCKCTWYVVRVQHAFPKIGLNIVAHAKKSRCALMLILIITSISWRFLFFCQLSMSQLENKVYNTSSAEKKNEQKSTDTTHKYGFQNCSHFIKFYYIYIFCCLVSTELNSISTSCQYFNFVYKIEIKNT